MTVEGSRKAFQSWIPFKKKAIGQQDPDLPAWKAAESNCQESRLHSKYARSAAGQGLAPGSRRNSTEGPPHLPTVKCPSGAGPSSLWLPPGRDL